MQPASPSDPRVFLSIGLTAHRDLVPEQEPALRVAVRQFFFQLRSDFPELPLRLISALAEGGDELVAEEALALGIELVVPLPMPQDEYERDFVELDALARFRHLLSQARVRVLPLARGITAEDIATRGESRNQQYAQLGMFISSHCQLLLALWDGNPSDAPGGTAQVVEFHLRNVMPDLSVAQVAPNLLADDDGDLVYHVRCSRRLAASAPAAALHVQWLTLAGTYTIERGVPEHYSHVFGQMEMLNRDMARNARAIASCASPLFDDTIPGELPPITSGVESLFRAADWLAIHFQRRVRFSLLCTHGIAALMGLAFILFSNISANRFFVGAFLALFLIGLLLTMIGRQRQWQRKYLDYRGLAEGLRVQLYWRMAGVETPPNSSLGYDSFLQKQDVELSWIRHAMRGTSLMRDEPFQPDSRWLSWVVEHWIGDRKGSGGQLQYYRLGTLRHEKAFQWTTRLGEVALAGGLLGGVTLLLGNEGMVVRMQQPLLLAMGMLPLLAGIREAYSYKKADKELIKQFRFMSRLFESCSERLQHAKSEAETRQLLLALGRACMEEHAKWILLHRERPLKHAELAG